MSFDLGKIFGAGKTVSEDLFKNGRDALFVAVPVTTLAATYLASKLLSPGAVKENLNDIVINANEKSNLAETVRDLERLRARKKLQSTAKIHDQFV